MDERSSRSRKRTMASPSIEVTKAITKMIMETIQSALVVQVGELVGAHQVVSEPEAEE
jgi:hypothetical protein